MKRDFASHLYEMKFLDSKDVKADSANRNSRNEALVRAVICAGLYPNVAQVRVGRGLARVSDDTYSCSHERFSDFGTVLDYTWS